MASDATTCHRQPGCSGPSRSSGDSCSCRPARGSFEYSRRYSHHHRLRYAVSGANLGGSGCMHCRADLFDRDGHFLGIAVGHRCFAAGEDWATRYSARVAGLAAAVRILSKGSRQSSVFVPYLLVPLILGKLLTLWLMGLRLLML
jgi:hypothetical protein